MLSGQTLKGLSLRQEPCGFLLELDSTTFHQAQVPPHGGPHSGPPSLVSSLRSSLASPSCKWFCFSKTIHLSYASSQKRTHVLFRSSIVLGTLPQTPGGSCVVLLKSCRISSVYGSRARFARKCNSLRELLWILSESLRFVSGSSVLVLTAPLASARGKARYARLAPSITCVLLQQE